MRGSLRRRDRRHHSDGPERWELRVFVGRGERGRQHRLYRAFRGTRREAESALAALITDVESGRQTQSSKTPFGEYATQWLASREAAGELAAKTLERYRGVVRDHLVPELGGIPLAASPQQPFARPSAPGATLRDAIVNGGISARSRYTIISPCSNRF